MTIDRRLLAGALALALGLGACGGSPTASGDAGAASAPATGTPAATASTTTPSEAPVATAEPTDDYGSGAGDGPLTELAGLLPARVGDTVYQRTGFDGDQLGMYGAMAGINGEQLQPILEKYGKTLNDVNFAISTAADDQAAGMVYAMQLEGVPAAELMGGMGMATSDLTRATVGGKEVWTAGGSGFGVWAYPRDDVLFVILLASDAIAEGLLEQLP